MDFQGVCTALARALEDLGAQTYDYEPDSVVAPAIAIYPERWPIADTTADCTFIIECFAGTTDTQSAQQQMMQWLGDGENSVALAIEADSTLGGAVSDAIALEVRRYGIKPSEGPRYLSAEIVCNVLR